MNYYEVLYILNPNFSKEQIAGVMSEVSSFVEKKKHGIVNHDFWGKKQLAYNVKKHKYGNFVLLNTEFKGKVSIKSSFPHKGNFEMFGKRCSKQNTGSMLCLPDHVD